jgi:DUF1680 family protein
VKLHTQINEKDYLDLVEFWLEGRGNHCGRPTTEQWSQNEPESQKWVREQKYGNSRPGWGAYAQDHKSIFKQETLEGHAVRATLMCAGLSAAARINSDSEYAASAKRLWENMVGKRMHITGGVGAFAHEEKFGSDYMLPNDAYLETCAAVGAGFFHQNMNLLFGDARYVDELERVLYNNVINGVSLEGNRYYYKNPLSTRQHHRWDWHGCPCCPPMFLKMASALPNYIYAYDKEGIYVNLFVGSKAEFLLNNNPVEIVQNTEYPWRGFISISLNPATEAEFAFKVRIPAWAKGWENPLGLYKSDLRSKIVLKLNGERLQNPKYVRGYAVMNRKWKKGDTIELELPMQPRRIYAHPEVEANRGRVAVQSGPLVYCLEGDGNLSMESIHLTHGTELRLEYTPNLYGGVNLIKMDAVGVRSNGQIKKKVFTAIPFYCQDNREDGGSVEVWLPEQKN